MVTGLRYTTSRTSEDQDGDRDLDRQAVLFARDGEVGDGGRGPGEVHCQWAVARGDVVFDDVGDSVV